LTRLTGMARGSYRSASVELGCAARAAMIPCAAFDTADF